VHLGALAGKPVNLVSGAEWRAWRESLQATGMQPSSVNRLMNGMRAALNALARLDRRVGKVRDEFREGLRRLPGADRARGQQVVLDDDTIRKIVGCAYEEDRALGALAELLAQSGTRVSQAARITVADLQADRARVMVPVSYKGTDDKADSH